MKHKNVMRLGSLLIVFSALLLSSVSCGSGETDTPRNKDTTEVPTEPAETELTEYDHLPKDLDFGGTEIVIHTRGDDTSLLEIGGKEEDGDILNDAIVLRNRAVEERLNVTLTRYAGEGWERYTNEMNKVRTSIAAGDNAWQLIAGWSYHSAALSLENLYLPLESMSYLDFDAPYWNRSVVENAGIGGHTYFLSGDVSFITSLGGGYVLYENERLAQQYDIEDVSQLVKDGKWTIDKLKTISRGAAHDINGSGSWDEDDQYGLALTLMNPADAFYICAGLTHIRMENGLPTLDIDMEREASLMEKIYPFFYEGDTVGAYMKDDYMTVCNMFMDGQSLFATLEFDSSRVFMRDMKDDFTMLPYPKFDEAQETYYTPTHNAITLWSIPADNPEPETAAAVMEAIASETRKSVINVYFETCMQEKIARNEKTMEMMQLLLDTSYVNTEGLFSKMFGDSLLSFRSMLYAKNSNVASWYEKNKPVFEKEIAKTVEALQKIQ